MAKCGRRPEQLLVLPGISPVIGRTEVEARARWAELQALTHPSVSCAHVVIELARREQFPVRQLYEYLEGARGHWVVVGTPKQIVDQMQSWFENGAADGFNVMPPVLPQSLDEFVAELIPELQRRGLFRTAYEGRTLRENLGLERPASRYAGAAKERAA